MKEAKMMTKITINKNIYDILFEYKTIVLDAIKYYAKYDLKRFNTSIKELIKRICKQIWDIQWSRNADNELNQTTLYSIYWEIIEDFRQFKTRETPSRFFIQNLEAISRMWFAFRVNKIKARATMVYYDTLCEKINHNERTLIYGNLCMIHAGLRSIVHNAPKYRDNEQLRIKIHQILTVLDEFDFEVNPCYELLNY
jgi:hypothetical protein